MNPPASQAWALSMADTAKRIGLHPDTFRKDRARLIAKKGFPAPIDNGRPRCPRWDPALVEAWLARPGRAFDVDHAREAAAANDDRDADRAARRHYARAPSQGRIHRDRAALAGLMQKGL